MLTWLPSTMNQRHREIGLKHSWLSAAAQRAPPIVPSSEITRLPPVSNENPPAAVKNPHPSLYEPFDKLVFL